MYGCVVVESVCVGVLCRGDNDGMDVERFIV